MPIITLTTDFGTDDHYVAAVKGVLLTLSPKSTVVDVTHHVRLGGVVQASFIMAQLPTTFPAGTVHLAIVDPMVGTPRAILAAESAGQFFVAPDNGLLTLAQQRWGLTGLVSVPTVAPTRTISQTFHGRDIMAPAAAELANTGRLAAVGDVIGQMELLDIHGAVEQADQCVGEVLYVDHFGNCTTNIPEQVVRQMILRGAGLTVFVGDLLIGSPVQAYADVPSGSPLALIGSAERLEVAVNLGSAADKLRLRPGSVVSLRRVDPQLLRAGAVQSAEAGR
jgi:S-adenosylmethionine hydrolase